MRQVCCGGKNDVAVWGPWSLTKPGVHISLGSEVENRVIESELTGVPKPVLTMGHLTRDHTEDFSHSNKCLAPEKCFSTAS